MSKDIFGKVMSAAVADDPYFPVDQFERWIRRESHEDAKLMAEAKVTVLPLGMRTLIASIEHESERYFCFVGLPVPDELPPALEIVDATPGLFSSVVVEANIISIATATAARGVLEGESNNNIDYSGHELKLILPLFPPLSFFRVCDKADEIYLKTLERVAGSYCSRGYQGFPLPLSRETLKRITGLFENGPDTIPYQLPLQGLLSYSFPALFLDLYRCLEQMYSVTRLSSLTRIISHEGSLSELTSVLETVLSWRPREEESLCSILNIISQNSKDTIVSAFCSDNTQLPEATAEKCAAYIYRVRNLHVHFRPAMRQEKIKDQQWDNIILSMCDAVAEVYEEFGDSFFEVRKSKDK